MAIPAKLGGRHSTISNDAAHDAAFVSSAGGQGRCVEQFDVVLDDIRQVHLLRFPYALYYFTDDARVIVIACAHGRHDPRR